MAPTRKQTAATAPAKKTAPRTAPSDYDFSSLTVADSAAPVRAGGRNARPNPFVAHLESSMAGKSQRPTKENANAWIGAGKSVTVPKQHAQEVINLLRYGANKLNIGVTVTDVEDPTLQRPKGTVEIRFAAKSRKQKRPTATTPTTGNGTTA